MPFLGLIDVRGQEIKGRGYHRLDMSEITFKITPPRDPSIHLTFVNQSPVRWPRAEGNWLEVSGCCIFAEIDDEKPLAVFQFDSLSKRVRAYELLAMERGQLIINHTVTPNERRNYRPPKPCPKCGYVTEETE